jgi:hypothetical protein
MLGSAAAPRDAAAARGGAPPQRRESATHADCRLLVGAVATTPPLAAVARSPSSASALKRVLGGRAPL